MPKTNQPPTIPPGMAVESVPIDDLHLDPANVRKHPDRNLAAIKASLARFGQQRPILVDSKGVVRAGNGTLAAARELGWERIEIIRTPLQGSEATAYAIADNRTAELATWDEGALGEQLRALQSEDFGLDAVGYDDGEVDALIEGLANGLADSDEIQFDEDSDDDETIGDGPKVFDDATVIEAAFRWFRETGFPYRNLPVHVSMQEINKLRSHEDPWRVDYGYHVADTYHPHRFHAMADGMRSPFDSFGEDAQLRRAIRIILEAGRSVPAGFFDGLKLVSGTQACSNFRPGFACKLYRDFCQSGSIVLDTSTGYGGRLVGFMASGIAGKYIGIDPNTLTHAGNLKMAADLGFADRVELHNLPAEDVSHEVVAGRCDFAFTSPPYFRKEHYSDEPTQSWKRYPTAEGWRNGFLGPMLALQYAALKPGSHAIVNIADVTIKGQVVPLVAWTIEAGKAAGFEYLRTDEFPMQKRFGAGHDDEVATEPVIVFRKPAQTVNGSKGR